MKRKSILKGATIEESLEFRAGEKAAWKVLDDGVKPERVHYEIKLPKYIENNNNELVHIAFGMGVDYATPIDFDLY